MGHRDENYWNSLYLSHETAWDIGFVSPPLQAYFDQIEQKDIKILIPGCGNSYEAEYLMQNGFTNVTVIDIAEEPVHRLKTVLQDYEGNGIEIILGDFFQYEFNKKFDLVVEQTFFCAIDPSLRNQYAKRMSQIISPYGKVAGVLFRSEFEKAGPPFGGTKEQYSNVFSPHFKNIRMEDCYNSHPKRQGNELFIRLSDPIL